MASSNTGEIVPDTFSSENHNDGASETASTTYASTISTYIRDGVTENGRQYATYGKHAYGMPVDDAEQERNDIQHIKFQLLLGDKLHSAPLESPERILDLGTGSGAWAFDMADKYESAKVTGVDLAPVQPAFVPDNCQFEVLDIEDEWLFRKASFDFIHARELILSIRDFPRLFRQAYDHIRPGGSMELTSSIASPSSDDGSLKPDAAILILERMFFEMGEKMNTPIDSPKKLKAQLEEAGFVDVVENIVKVPHGPWPKDARLKKLGAFENYILSSGLEAYLMRGYTSVMGGDPETLRPLLEQTRKELADPGLHSFIYYYNVYGRKPSLETPITPI